LGRGAPFGGAAGPPRLHVPVQAAAAARAGALVPEGRGPLIGLAPGSVWATKRWRPEGFAAVLRAFREQGAGVVVLGAPEERVIAEDGVRRAGGGGTVLAGRAPRAGGWSGTRRRGVPPDRSTPCPRCPRA